MLREVTCCADCPFFRWNPEPQERECGAMQEPTFTFFEGWRIGEKNPNGKGKKGKQFYRITPINQDIREVHVKCPLKKEQVVVQLTQISLLPTNQT